MPYFKDVKVGDEVYGTVYGSGVVSNMLGKDHQYTFEVEFKVNDQKVFYTEDGIPSWGSMINQQTVFFKNDIDLMNFDIEPIEKILKPKNILKLKILKELEMRCPSGIWRPVHSCPEELFENAIMNEQFHVFRKTKKQKES